MMTPPVPRVEVAALWRGGKPEEIERACLEIERAAHPRYTASEYDCARLSTLWQGYDIHRHLGKCARCVLIAMTLGTQIDMLLRSAGIRDIKEETLLDTAASCLAEACAEQAERELRAQYERRGLFLTHRFSPGYGDFPLSVQPEILRLTSAEKRIGLTVTETLILLPRKSVTAVCGISETPYDGALAGCEHCALRETCRRRKEGNPCGKQNVDP